MEGGQDCWWVVRYTSSPINVAEEDANVSDGTPFIGRSTCNVNRAASSKKVINIYGKVYIEARRTTNHKDGGGYYGSTAMYSCTLSIGLVTTCTDAHGRQQG